MAFLSAGSNFVAEAPSFSQLLAQAPAFDKDILTQAAVKRADMTQGLINRVFDYKADMALERQRQKAQEKQQEALRRQSLVSSLSGLSTRLGGGSTRMAGDSLMSLLAPSSAAQGLSDLNKVLGQQNLLFSNLGITGLNASGSFAGAAIGSQ